MSEALTVIHDAETALARPLHPREIIRQATEEANELASVIESRKLYSNIQGKKFVRCEGWTTLACLRGCLPREISVQEVGEGRYVAEVALIRMSDGTVMTQASAECGGPEDQVWQSRPPNARRSMAITRATGKACRIAFSWVMALSGYEPTPAEEMDHVGDNSDRSPGGRPNLSTPPPITRPVSIPQGAPGGGAWRGKILSFEKKDGSTRGKPWTLFTFRGDDETKFGTFDTAIAEKLVEWEGRFVEIVSEETGRGNSKIVEVRDVTAEEAPFSDAP